MPEQEILLHFINATINGSIRIDWPNWDINQVQISNQFQFYLVVVVYNSREAALSDVFFTTANEVLSIWSHICALCPFGTQFSHVSLDSWKSLVNFASGENNEAFLFSLLGTSLKQTYIVANKHR